MSDQGETYLHFVESQLKNEMDRKERLDNRGVGVVTSASGLATLSLTLGAVFLGKDFQVSGGSALLLLVSAVSFLLAAGGGIATSFNRAYDVAASRTLNRMLNGHWTDTEVTARNHCATLSVKTIDSLRRVNNKKSGYLTLALVFELLAIGSFYVGAVLAYSPS